MCKITIVPFKKVLIVAVLPYNDLQGDFPSINEMHSVMVSLASIPTLNYTVTRYFANNVTNRHINQVSYNLFIIAHKI